MGSTANYGWPYPEGSDAPPDVPARMQALAEAIDGDVKAIDDAVVPLDTVGTNITGSAPGDTKAAGSTGMAADAGHRHPRESPPITDVTIPFYIANTLTTGLKNPKWIATRNGTLKHGYGVLDSGSGAVWRAYVNGASPTGMTDSPSTDTTPDLHDFADVNFNAGDIIQINVVNAGSSASGLSVTLDAAWR